MDLEAMMCEILKLQLGGVGLAKCLALVLGMSGGIGVGVAMCLALVLGMSHDPIVPVPHHVASWVGGNVKARKIKV